MQATAASAQASASGLARDLFALLSYLLKASSQDVFSSLGELDLSLTQVKLLHVLDAEPSVSLKHVGSCVGLSLPAASRAIEALHQRGLVERHEDEHDRRIKRVEVTEAGREVVRRLNQARLAYLEQFAVTLNERERERLVGALAPLLERAPIAACHPDRKEPS
ncbi:MAG: MarR family transcriptional regulator [Actinomycetota bacterium]|nr:MarR family transcriptional regulator [Actinomycetota bacterium]